VRDRKFGQTDLALSAIGLGCNNFGVRLDVSAAERVVNTALDAGVTVFDTADIYGRGKSEEFLGGALGTRRHDAVIITKFGLPMDQSAKPRDGSPDYVIRAVEASLKRLRTDWIDIYLLHRPDPATPIEATLRALDTLIDQGKVRYAGCSNMTASQINEAQQVAKTGGLRGFVCCEDQYNLLSRQIEKDVIPAMEMHGLALLPYFPLASGMLTGKYEAGAPLPEGARLSNKRYSDRFLNDDNFRIVEALRSYCAQRGRSLLELAFGWLLTKPIIGSVIAGASSPEQLLQNISAMDWRLSAAELGEVNEMTKRGN
jgi:aryl-alcohol dehydrogenase-like predicted oxidoreductase